MNKKIPLGVVGLHFGKHMLAELTRPPASQYVDVQAVCDLSRERTDQAAAAYKVRPYYALDDLLADDSIRAVALFTGPVGRAALVRQIIRAGRDVITTKPFELDPDAALAVLREAEQRGRVVHLNSPSPVLSAELQLTRQWQDHYRLGRPVACRMDTWVRYSEKPDGTWMDDPKRCPAAPIFRLGIYLINDMVRFLGEPTEVFAMQSRLFTERPTADHAQLSIRFANGALGNIFASFCINDGCASKNSMILNFENGTVYRNIYPTMTSHVMPMSEMCVVTHHPQAGHVAERVDVRAASGHYQWEAFYRAVNGERLEGAVTPAEIVAGLRVIEAMKLSLKSGRPASVAQSPDLSASRFR